MPFTLSTFKRGICGIHVVNASDEDAFLSAGTQLGTVSDVSIDLSSHFKVIGSQEVNISKQPNIGYVIGYGLPVMWRHFVRIVTDMR